MTDPSLFKLDGRDGAEVFRELPPGQKIRLTDGAIAEISENPGDGAYLLIKILEDAARSDRAGDEEVVYFTSVQSVISEEAQ